MKRYLFYRNFSDSYSFELPQNEEIINLVKGIMSYDEYYTLIAEIEGNLILNNNENNCNVFEDLRKWMEVIYWCYYDEGTDEEVKINDLLNKLSEKLKQINL